MKGRARMREGKDDWDNEEWVKTEKDRFFLRRRITITDIYRDRRKHVCLLDEEEEAGE